MGDILSNLHILVRNRGITAEAIAEAVEVALNLQGYTGVEEVEDGQSAYFLVAGGDWVSLTNWNLEQDGVEVNELRSLAAPLSGTLGCPIMGLELFEEDVLTLRLYEGGALKDTFTNWANYPETPKEVRGDADKWVSLLPEGETPTELREAWENTAEDLAETMDTMLSILPEGMKDALSALLPGDSEEMGQALETDAILYAVMDLLDLPEELVFQDGNALLNIMEEAEDGEEIWEEGDVSDDGALSGVTDEDYDEDEFDEGDYDDIIDIEIISMYFAR